MKKNKYSIPAAQKTAPSVFVVPSFSFRKYALELWVWEPVEKVRDLQRRIENANAEKREQMMMGFQEIEKKTCAVLGISLAGVGQ